MSYRVGLALLLVLLTATSVSAECAWALWAEGIRDGKPIESFPADSFTSLRECKESEKIYRKPRDPNTGDLTITVCLPDTVDPRRPRQ